MNPQPDSTASNPATQDARPETRDPRLKKPVALITGGGRGIGLGISQKLAAEGYDIAFCGVRDADAVEEQTALLRGLGAEVQYIQADISESADRAKLVDAVKQHFGRLHVLVNNAGVAPKQRLDLLEATEESYEWVMKVNLQGPYFLTQAVANWMVEQQQAHPDFKGSIINIGSISATVASPARGEYCLSKTGMGMMTHLFSVRMAEYNIPVYEIRPGITASDMTSGVKEKYDKLIADGLLLQPRWGTPEDVGKAVALLARGDLPYSTGQVIMVDGGLTSLRL